MPFCSQCGNQVGGRDAFCGRCGGRQPVSAKPASRSPFADLSSRNASLLCYIPLVGWIPAIVILASARFKHDREVRFNAFQGLYLFVTWLVIDWAVGPFFHLPAEYIKISIIGIVKIAIFATWIFMIVKTSQHETYRLPVLGELAERSLAEQR